MEAKDLIKDSILKSAQDLVNQFGYGALSISELARYSNITKQRLYYHFKTPEEIIMVLAERWGRSGQESAIRALANTNEIGVYKVLAMSQGLFDWMKSDFNLARIGLVLFQSSAHIKSLNEIMTQVRTTGRDRIKSFLMQEKVFQKMKKDQLEEVVTSLHSQMYGAYFYVVTMNDFKKIKDHQRNCDNTLRAIIDSHLK